MKKFEIIGSFLREKRIKAGLSQTEVADVLHVKPQFVSNWERGMSAPPLRLAKFLMKAYRIPSQEMLSMLLSAEEVRLKAGLKIK